MSIRREGLAHSRIQVLFLCLEVSQRKWDNIFWGKGEQGVCLLSMTEEQSDEERRVELEDVLLPLRARQQQKLS